MTVTDVTGVTDVSAATEVAGPALIDGQHFYILGPDQRGTVPGYWSHSAAQKAGAPGACGLEWAYRNGPLRDQAPAEIAPHPHRLRGNVVHDAFAAGMRAAVADAERAGPRSTLVGSSLERYWPVVRREFGAAWDRYRMPSDQAEAVLCDRILRYMLRVTRVPASGSVWALEDTRVTQTPAGREFHYVLDFARWVHGRARLRLTDWKTGQDDPDDVAENPQMLRYAWCAAHDAGIPLERVEIELHNVRTERSRIERVNPRAARRAMEVVDDIAARMEAAVRSGALPAKPGGRCSSCAACESCPVRAAYRAPEREE